MREWIWSFSSMLRTWFFTDISEMNSSFEMSRLFMPRATSLSTSISRSVSLGAAKCWARSSPVSRLARVANSVSSLPGHRRVDQRLPAVHGSDRLGHLVERDVLEQAAYATGIASNRSSSSSPMVAHHDLRAGRDVLGRPAGLDPAGLRHPDVHEHDVGQRLAGHGDRLGTVAGLPDQVDVVLLIQDHLQTTPEQGMIVGDQHPDRLGTSPRVRPLGSSHRCVAASAQFVASLWCHHQTLADGRP